MSPYRVHLAPVDLEELARASAVQSPRNLALRAVLAVGLVAVAIALVASVTTSIEPAPSTRSVPRRRADPHRVAAARDEEAAAPNGRSEDELFRELGMSALAARYTTPKPTPLPDTSAIHGVH